MVLPLPLIGAGLGALGNVVGGIMQNNAAKDAARRNTALAREFRDEGLGYLDTGTERAAGYLDQVPGLYAPLAEMGQAGSTMYANALGLNGASGNAAATNAFQAGPGYEFAMDQGLGALERRAAAQGRLQSGQTGLDTLGYATGLADQTYGSWLDRLGGMQNTWAAGLQGQAGGLNNLANLYTGDANSRVNLTGTVLQSMQGANNQRAAGGQALGASIGNAMGGFGGFLGGYGGFN